MSQERLKVIKKFIDLGFSVEVGTNIFDSDVSDLISQSRVVLNMPFYSNSSFEEFRFAQMAGYGSVFKSIEIDRDRPRILNDVCPHIFDSFDGIVDFLRLYENSPQLIEKYLNSQLDALSLMNFEFKLNFDLECLG